MEFVNHEPIFAGYVWCLVQQRLIPALRSHGYRIVSSEPSVHETKGNWELKVFLNPTDVISSVEDNHQAAIEIHFLGAGIGLPLKVKSSHVNFMMVLEVGKELAVYNLNNLKLETKHPVLVEMIEKFIDEAVTKMLKEAKNIP